MPYNVKKVKGGFKVFSPNGPKSKRPMTLRQAHAQQRAIYANSGSHRDASMLAKPTRKGNK